MRIVIAVLILAAALLSSRPAVAAIPEPPPYPWEYHARGTVAFIPCVIHSGVLIPPGRLQPGW